MTNLVARYWLWWLAAVFFSWLPAELFLIWLAHHRGERNIQEWTLSDTVRRWRAEYRWLAPIAVGTMAMLMYHFFIETNP